MLRTVEAAFFDLDKTVIAKASMVAFGRPLLAEGFISRRLMVRALWNNLIFHWMGADEEQMRKFRESALRITRGWDQALISSLVRDNLTEVIEPIVYDEALDLIRAHQAAGREVYLVSASPIEIVAPLGTFLRVDGTIASQARIDEAGRYTGEVDFYSYGPFKAEAITELAAERGIDLAASFAYSDSATDLPMLEVVGHPVVVNPDKELRRIARERDWEVRFFEHGVPLGERVALPSRIRVAVALMLLTALATGVVVWRRRSALSPPKRRETGHLDMRAVPGRAAARLRRVERRRAGAGTASGSAQGRRAGRSPVTGLVRRRPAASSRRRRRGRAGRR